MRELDQEGTFPAELLSAYLTESKGQTLGIVFEFRTEEGDISYTQWVTPNTADRAWQNLETLGFTKKHGEDMDNLDKLTEICGGHRCKIVTKFEEYQGNQTLKVQWINPIGGIKSVAPETKQGIHALLNGNSFTRPAPRSAAQRPSEPPPNSPNNQDVPF